MTSGALSLFRSGKIFLAAAFSAWSLAGATPPPPGTEIPNSARVDYLTGLSSTLTVTSNEVVTVTASGAVFTLTQDRTLTATSGSTVVLVHTLSNVGAYTESYRLDYRNLSGDSYDLSSLALVRDLNGNGMADSGEPALASGDAISLTAGQSATLLLVGTLPGALGDNTQAHLELIATSLSSSQGTVNTDTITARTPALHLTKSAAPLAPARGGKVTFTLNASNNGGDAAPVHVTVDGVAADYVLVRDVIPANTSFAAFTQLAGSVGLYQLAGEDLTTWHSRPPANLSSVSSVAIGLAQLPSSASATLGFQVSVNANASGPIENTAEVIAANGSLVTRLNSNTVVITPPTVAPILTFYRDVNFSEPTVIGNLGLPLHLAIDAAACNRDPLSIETIVVVIESALTGDRESFTAIETAPNSGIFKIQAVPTADGARTAVVRGDGTLQSVSRDTLTASLEGCGGTLTIATLQIDPSGVVYDSLTCRPASGVKVTLLDVTGAGNGGRAGQAAAVFLADGVSSAPNPVTTDLDGVYIFPRVLPSVYRIAVQGPPLSVFPSALPPSCTSDHPVATGSHGEPFPVDATTGAVFIDLAVDNPISGGFTLKKTASRVIVEAGDSVVYTLELTNNTKFDLGPTVLDDRLPAGFTYEAGSSRANGGVLPNPTGGRGPELTFALGAIPAGNTLKLSYRVRVERDAPSGDALNTAVAHTTTGPQVRSATATAKVVVEDGVFTDKGILLGKVFVDTNRNRVQDANEPGIPGVRVYLENGSFAVTDSEGKYSIYGLRPIAHVLKLDRTTLPAGSEVIALDTRNAGDGGSRFVDLKKAELHKADFAIDGTSRAVMAEVERRRSKGEVSVAEIAQTLQRRLESDTRDKPISDPRALASAGTIGGGSGGESSESTGALAGGRSSFTALLPPGTLTSANSSVAPEPVTQIAGLPLEVFMEGLSDNTPGFIGLRNGDTVPGRQINVRVKGPLGTQFSLLLNGAPVAATRLGKRVTDAVRQIEACEFIGIDLKAGENALEFVVRDPFGNERGRASAKIIAPDRLARIEISFSNPEPTADGRTPVRMSVRLVDAAGTPVTAPTPLTLESSLGRWETDDLNASEPGTQVFIEGQGRYTLLPPDAPGDARIVVSSGAIKREVVLPFLPDLRPLIASGVLEGTLFLRNGTSLGLSSASASDAFEEELRELSSSGDLRTSGRAAFFVKGKIKGNVLLTAAYDSDKNTRERLFRDIEPDKYYPVYGDSSLRGFDAQSSRRLYVRIDRKRSYLLLGDFQTRTDGEQRSLGNYQRSLNGVRGHLENQRVVADAWAARDTTSQVVQEIPADGTSGPYQFRAANGLLNSERVEILTRDRNQPSLVLQTEVKQRFSDYDFEPFTGRLLFTGPVRGLDENLNPRSIRITYEVDQGGDPFWIYGANAQVRVTKSIEVGGSFARDENPRDRQRLASANTTLRLAENTFLLGEIAQSETDLRGTGFAGRIDLRHKDAKTDARLYYGETESRFVNPGALLTPGRIEAGTKITRRLSERNQLVVQGLVTEDTASAGGKRQGVRADVEHLFESRLKLEVGARRSEESGNPAGFSTRPGATSGNSSAPAVTPFEVNSLRVKLTAPIRRLKDASFYGEYEQDLIKVDQQLVALGGDWQFSPRGRLYARHEFLSSIGGPFELNQTQQNNITVIGVETDYLKNGQFFNEYRARDSFNGREAEASTGVRHQLQLAPGLRLQASVERITPFDGTKQNESTSITTGVEYTDNPLWKGTARAEVRLANQSDSLLNTLGYARKLDRDWTFLGKTIVYDVNNKAVTARDTLEARLLTGLAWRQTASDVWNALSKYEYRYEKGSAFDPTLDQERNVHIFSVSANYQPSRDWIFSSRYAFKFVDETVIGQHASYVGQQLNFRALRELSKHWDAGLSASLGWSHGFARSDWALGPEAGYNFRTNMRLGVGYNIAGFRDRDLSGDIPTQRGVFLNLRVKFDEGFFALRALAEGDDPEHKEAKK